MDIKQMSKKLEAMKQYKAKDKFEVLWQSIRKQENCTAQQAMSKAATLNPDLYENVRQGL